MLPTSLTMPPPSTDLGDEGGVVAGRRDGARHCYLPLVQSRGRKPGRSDMMSSRVGAGPWMRRAGTVREAVETTTKMKKKSVRRQASGWRGLGVGGVDGGGTPLGAWSPDRWSKTIEMAMEAGRRDSICGTLALAERKVIRTPLPIAQAEHPSCRKGLMWPKAG
ncbi:hypothetical protein GW17_00048892 [Ensete ventricosum]|nr:hypothetical protein GW17_00048892 [Ensete ventricosum]